MHKMLAPHWLLRNVQSCDVSAITNWSSLSKKTCPRLFSQEPRVPWFPALTFNPFPFPAMPHAAPGAHPFLPEQTPRPWWLAPLDWGCRGDEEEATVHRRGLGYLWAPLGAHKEVGLVAAWPVIIQEGSRLSYQLLHCCQGLQLPHTGGVQVETLQPLQGTQWACYWLNKWAT